VNPIFMHDQCLAYIQDEALYTKLASGLSFELLAKEFEVYWRGRIAVEVRSKLMPICVCARCDNLFEASIVDGALKVIRGNST
jgi:hypothetical protein